MGLLVVAKAKFLWYMIDTSSNLCFVDAFDVWSREVSVDLIDVLLVHVLWYGVLVQVVHHVGARQHPVHLNPEL